MILYDYIICFHMIVDISEYFFVFWNKEKFGFLNGFTFFFF